MNRAEGIELLHNVLPNDESPEYDVADLAEELDYLPLAIKQAGSYINVKNTRTTITKYLQRFRKNKEIQKRLLREDFADVSRNNGLKNSVILTLQMSLDQIHSQKPAAVDLLAYMSCFDRQSIPEIFLLVSNKDELDFEESITTLLNYSLVTALEHDNFSMHRLVQLTMQMRLEAHGEIIKWLELALRAVFVFSPFPWLNNYKNWPLTQLVYPHAQTLFQYVRPFILTVSLESINCIICNELTMNLDCLGKYSLLKRLGEVFAIFCILQLRLKAK